MKFRATAIAASVLMLTACGGGGGGGSSTAVPTAKTIKSINVAAAMTKLLTTSQSWPTLEATDGTTGFINFGVRSVTVFPFVTNGVSVNTSFSSEMSLVFHDSKGLISNKSYWKFHFDSSMKPTGIAYADDIFNYKSCYTPVNVNVLPTLSNSSGTYIAGNASGNYTEDYRGAVTTTTNNLVFAHYCDNKSTTTTNFNWSVADGDPYPYVCLTMPSMYPATEGRICVAADDAGNLIPAVRVQFFDNTGKFIREFINKSTNTPL